MAAIPVDPKRFDNTGSVQENAQKHRVNVAKTLIADVPKAHADNGDFARADRAGSFTKGLPHDATTGLVDPTAFAAFVAALGQPRHQVLGALEAIPTSQAGSGTNTRKWVNPVAGRAFAVVGGDPQQYEIPKAPAIGSAGETFEIVENYWMALLRDVPFSQYGSHPLAAQAASELGNLHGPARAERQAETGRNADLAAVDGMGKITSALLFRGLTPGDAAGPYLSQFLIHPVPFGAQGFEQRNRTLRAGTEFMTDWDEWRHVQNGAPRDFVPSHFDPVLHYLRNGRDLSQWVHVDVLFQGYFNACLMLLQGTGAASSVGGGIGSGPGRHNPYAATRRQQGFGKLGDPGHIGMMCEVATLALKAVWYQKWYVHLRLRPEAYAGRIEAQRSGRKSFGLPAALMGSQAVAHTVARHGTALLPMAFPEGSPMHPAYGAGHATVAGACVTILKALFGNVGVPFPNPVDIAVDATGNERIVPHAGTLTVQGELDKLASNIALGRNIAGVHWRSDGTESLLLGEMVAVDLLRAYARSYAEVGSGSPAFEFVDFQGSVQTISA